MSFLISLFKIQIVFLLCLLSIGLSYCLNIWLLLPDVIEKMCWCENTVTWRKSEMMSYIDWNKQINHVFKWYHSIVLGRSNNLFLYQLQNKIYNYKSFLLALNHWLRVKLSTRCARLVILKWNNGGKYLIWVLKKNSKLLKPWSLHSFKFYLYGQVLKFTKWTCSCWSIRIINKKS